MQHTIPEMIASQPTVRQAVEGDIPILNALMEQSVRHLNVQDYGQQQLESALEHIFGIDHHLIADGTYYVAEIDGAVAGCGGWSRNGKLYGGAQVHAIPQDPQLRNPEEVAKIRAMFVHPKFARRGVGTRLMQICELAARRAGFRRLELIATLTGEPFYHKMGFTPLDRFDLVMPDGLSLQALRMAKQL
jgi:N-acetylglutamate synthase-like GNAT family acetyltransferase